MAFEAGGATGADLGHGDGVEAMVGLERAGMAGRAASLSVEESQSVQSGPGEHFLAAQMPVAEKAAVADHVVDNGGDQAATEAQIDALWDRLVGGAA